MDMDQLGVKIVMLRRQEMCSLSKALNMTADMIEGSFDEDDQPVSPPVLRAVALGGATSDCPGSDATIPAAICLTVRDDEIPNGQACAGVLYRCLPQLCASRGPNR
jgi:hypothetical protein